MNGILKIRLQDLTQQFLQGLGEKLSGATEVEIRFPQKKKKDMFPDAKFWQIIDGFDWDKSNAKGILQPAVDQLANLPVVDIYLFEDKLAEKLFQLDTRQHGIAYLKNEPDDYLSVDDFLYVRCAIVAEGKFFFEKVLNDPTELNSELSFEPLLNLASTAYLKKTGRKFNYHSPLSYETYSNKEGWK